MTATEKAPITAQSIRKEGPQILQEVDAAHIFQTHPAREFPRFAKLELQLGSLLGSGGFSNVYEIDNIQLISSDDSDGTTVPKNANDQDHHQHHRDEHEDHYEVETARVWMSQRTQRKGSARYALKRLRDDLSHIDQARGALDLAIEIQFLSTLWHPNISMLLCVYYESRRHWPPSHNHLLISLRAIATAIIFSQDERLLTIGTTHQPG